MTFQPGQKARRKSTGDIVTIIQNIGIINAMNVTMYRVQELNSNKYPEVMEIDLEPYEFKESVTDAFRAWHFGDFYSFRKALTHIRVRGELTNILYSMHYGDVEFKPHQFKPVMKFLQSLNGRLLIADEVGLGKTIEALYIWKELQAREDAKRLLVVCPHSLVDKWEMDMKRLFSITDARIVNAKEFLEKCEDMAKMPSVSCSFVTGIEAIRSKEKDPKEEKIRTTAKDRLRVFLSSQVDENEREKLFDLVIVDEAHIVRNYSTCNYKIIELLRENSKNLVLLSATPIQTSSTNLFNLMRLMEPEEYDNGSNSKDVFDEILKENESVVSLAKIFYKKYGDNIFELNNAYSFALNTIHQIEKTKYYGNSTLFESLIPNLRERLVNDELRLETYNQIVHSYFYDSVISRTRKKDVPGESKIRSAQTVSFRLNKKELEIYHKVTAKLKNTIRDNDSKVHEFVIMLKQREMASSIPAALKKWAGIYYQERESSDLYEEIFGDGNDEEITFDYKIGNIDSSSVTPNDIKELELHDSKYQIFRDDVIRKELSDNSNEKIIVFSFFTATLQYLEERLRNDGIRVLRMDGSIKERTEIIKKFRNENISVLLSSEVGSEGLDMQFARIEVNYDLPWNPMRLEQRIGRIDRIGQKSPVVNIVNLICGNTVEDRILLRLYDRIEIFKKSIGEIDEILGTLTTDIQRSLLNPDPTEDQLLEQAEQRINATIIQKQLTDSLEENAGISKEYSDAIMKYIQETSNNNRFIRREDLLHYIEDFFDYYGKGSTITPINGKPENEFRHIKLSDSADESFKKFVSENKQKGLIHHANIGTRGIDCCFPQGKQIPGFISIDINDSLIRWIYDVIERNRGNENPYCFALNLRRDKTPSPETLNRGVYVFLIKEINFKGLRVRRELLHVVMDVNNKTFFPVSTGEFIISQALFFGEPISNLNMYKANSQTLNNRLAACVKHSMELYNKAADEFVLENDSFKTLQLNKAAKVYEYQKNTVLESLNNPLMSDAIKRMNQGRLEKLEERYLLQLEIIAKKSQYVTESANLATGVIVIL